MWYQKEKNPCNFDKHVFQRKIIPYLCDAACKGRNSQGSDKRKMCIKVCYKVVNNLQVKLQNIVVSRATGVSKNALHSFLYDSVEAE